MARIRTVKPELFTSASVGGLPIEARWLFAAMLTQADDEGYLREDVTLMRSVVFLRDHAVTDQHVAAWINAMIEAGLVQRSEAQERKSTKIVTIWLVNGFAEHQVINRPTKSKYVQIGDALDSFIENSLNTHGSFTDDSLPERKGKEGKGKELGKERKDDSLIFDEPLDLSQSDGFDEFWKVYPVKQGKQEARKAWLSIPKGVSRDHIITAASAYRVWMETHPNPPSPKWAQGWLNSRRWDDEYPVHKPTNNSFRSRNLTEASRLVKDNGPTWPQMIGE
jgi:hypothetical protein